VVSGAVNPDQFTLDTATAAVLRRVRGHDDPAPGFSLADNELGELTRLGDAVQRLFGAPQDVEWVFDAAGTLWLTQSRPITTLYPLQDPLSRDPSALNPDPDGGTRVYLCGTLLQGLTRPITPIGLAALGLMRNRRGPWRYINPGLRMYVDLTALVHNKWGRRYLTRILPLADGRSAAIFPELLADPRFAAIEQPRKSRRRTPRPGRAPRTRGTEAGASLGMVLGLVPALIGAALRPAAELRRVDAYGKRLAAELVLPEPATSLQRLDYAEQITNRTIDGLIRATLPAPSVGYIMLAVARRLLRGIAPPRELEAVLRGLPHNVTTEMDLELWQLAAQIAGAPRGRLSWRSRRPGWPPPTAPAPSPLRPRAESGISWPATATARWPKLTSACRAGRMNRTISWA